MARPDLDYVGVIKLPDHFHRGIGSSTIYLRNFLVPGVNLGERCTQPS